jgi:hypothetical protein
VKPLARLASVACALAAAAALSGCGKAEARMPAPAPPLDMPAPPARVIIPVTVVVPEPPPPPVVEDPAARPARPPAAPPARPPERTSPPAGTPPETPPVLQPTTNIAALEQQARDLLDAAKKDLGRVNRRALGPDAREQFDTAERFIRMADAALAARNVVYAHQLAQNAAALAGLLVKGDPAGAIAP